VGEKERKGRGQKKLLEQLAHVSQKPGERVVKNENSGRYMVLLAGENQEKHFESKNTVSTRWRRDEGKEKWRASRIRLVKT